MMMTVIHPGHQNWRTTLLKWTLGLLLGTSSPGVNQARAQRQMEHLGRGVVALRQDNDTVYVGWRLLGTDPDSIAFNLYRTADASPAVKLNALPLQRTTDFVDVTASRTQDYAYFVRPVLNGVELPSSAPFALSAQAPVQPYISIPLQTPAGYVPNDASVGDLDGDGEYADIFGDWREEVIYRTSDNSELRIFSMVIPATNRFRTFMHEPQYRISVACQSRLGLIDHPHHQPLYR